MDDIAEVTVCFDQIYSSSPVARAKYPNGMAVSAVPGPTVHLI